MPSGRRESRDRLQTRIVWLAREPLAPGRSYLIKLGTYERRGHGRGSAARARSRHAGAVKAAERLFINDIGDCALRLDRAIAADRYADSKETGSFILIDPEILRHCRHGLRRKARARARSLLARAAAAGSAARGAQAAKAMPARWRGLALARS